MDPVKYIVGAGVLMIVSGIAGAMLAGMKNRDYSFWAAWSFVLPPALIVLLLLPKNHGPRPRRPSLDEEDRMHP